jgi:hypothetical protein
MEEETGIRCLGFSEPCESMNATRVRLRTAYVDEERNWDTLCPKCQEDANEYWGEIWRKYRYSQVL